MIALLDNNQDLEDCRQEIGCEIGQLLTPLTRRVLRDPALPWAIDNGAYSSNFSLKLFLSLLDRHAHNSASCLFVAVPDVVASARRTLEVFEHWKPRLVGWRLALVCQDGQEHLPIPWDDIAAVFIGGTTAWKVSPAAAQVVRAAQMLDKWVHVGRVNTPERWEYFEELGAHSADGTGIARYSHMRHAIADRHDQAKLGFEL